MALREASAGAADLQLLAEKARHGERPALHDPGPDPAGAGDVLRLLAYDLERERYAARVAVVRVAACSPAGRPDSRVEVFVNLARRMQSLLAAKCGLDEVEDRSKTRIY